MRNRIFKVLKVHTKSRDPLVSKARSLKKPRRLAQLTAEDLERLFEVHCVGAFRCTLVALPFLRRTERPIVVNITE
jgi:NAD(P)-dependent dehydrogenase (short-subunit alcohol dehydrogenase family)